MTHHVRISQVATVDDCSHVEVATYIPGRNPEHESHRVETFRLPSSRDDEERLSWYLETHPKDDPFPLGRARDVQQWLGTYRQSIVDQLQLADVFSSAFASRTNVIIAIHGDHDFQAMHWEVLESLLPPSLASDAGSIIAVKRCVLHRKICSLDISSLRILCVVSRRPAKKGNQGYLDADFRNVVAPLVYMPREPATHIHLDIVRPGTWLAFLSALDSKPDNFYNIVHFDVHGGIRPSPKSHELEPVILFRRQIITKSKHQVDVVEDYKNATTVAAVLVAKGVRLVVLNACRSASTRAGGSFAQILVQNGVPSVVGMSFNMHETAAKIFINSFYRSLLGSPDILGASVYARYALRKENNRKSLFDIPVAIDDWLLPVLYEVESDNEQPHLRMVSGLPDAATNSNIPPLIGRSGIILFLEEDLLIKSRVVVLSGCRGVGKRTLLYHLAQWWVDSKFVDVVYACDFKKLSSAHSTSPTGRAFSVGRLVSALDNLISCVGSSTSGVFNINVEPCSLSEFWDPYPDATSDRVTKHFSSRRCLLLLQNINWVKVFLPELDVWYRQLGGFLQSFDSNETHSFAILSSTSAEPSLSWRSKVTIAAYQNGPTNHTLDGLDHFSAIQLISPLLDSAQHAKYINEGLEHVYLENIVDMFEGHPLACQLVFEKFHSSPLSPRAFFHQLLTAPSEIDWASSQLTDHVSSYIVALMALNANPGFEFFGLIQVPLYVPRSYFFWLLKMPEDDPSAVKECDDVMETLEDMEVGQRVHRTPDNKLTEDGFELNPMFSLFLRDQRSMPIENTNPFDFALFVLANFYAGRCDAWISSGKVGQVDTLLSDKQNNIAREWGNILRVLRYLVQQPFNWDVDAERWFDPVFSFAALASICHLSPHQDALTGWKDMGLMVRYRSVITDIAQLAIDRIIHAFIPSLNAGSPWWMQLNVGSTSSGYAASSHTMGMVEGPHTSTKSVSHKVADWLSDHIKLGARSSGGATSLHAKEGIDISHAPDSSLGPELPDWLFDRILIICQFQAVIAYRNFSADAWDHNEVIRGLCRRWRTLGRTMSAKLLYTECNSVVLAMDIAEQTQRHIPESLAAFADYDFDELKKDDQMAQYVKHIQTRAAIVRGELMGFIFDIDQVWAQTSKKAGHFIGEPELDREAYGPDHVLSDRWFYEHAMARTRSDIASIPDTLSHLSQSLKSAISRNDKGYEVVLRQFLYDLYETIQEWDAAIMHLHAIGKFVFRGDEEFNALLHADGQDSYVKDWKRKNDKWCAHIEDQTAMQKYREEAEVLLKEYHAMHPRCGAHDKKRELEEEGNRNLWTALQIALQMSEIEHPSGFKKLEFTRVLVSAKK